MVVTEKVTINGTEYIHNYSDTGYMIEREGKRYADAIDPIGFDRVYVETNELIEAVEEPIE